MVKTLFKIRLFQYYRLLKDFGLIRLILLMGFLAVLGYIAYNQIIKDQNTIFAVLIIGLSLLSIHVFRKDKHFLKHIFINSYWIYFVEYTVLLLPIQVIWLIEGNYVGASIITCLCLLIPLLYLNAGIHSAQSFIKLLINPFSSNLNFKINIPIKFIQPLAFEWISGIRASFIILIPLYILFLAFAFKPYVAPVGIIIISLIVSGFYYEGESRELIEIFAHNSNQFLRKKIVLCNKYLLSLITPILLIALIFQIQTWYYIIGAVVISAMMQSITIIFKYALFEENINLSRNSLIVIVNIIFLIVPIFWPVPIIMGIRYFYKAKRNLNPYFNA